MLQRIALAVLAIAVLSGGGFLAYAWYPAITPITRPNPASFSRDAVARGEIVANSGYCVECHTRTDLGGGPELAGDYRMNTPFGAIFSPNITPDVETGIGTWSEAAFRRSMYRGVDRSGAHLYPAFPFNHFTRMSEQDISDLYAYLMTRPAVRMTHRANTLPFPLNLRILEAGWALLFVSPGRYQADPAHDAQWNRGAYLAEGVAHCGACHTPRNLLQAEKTSAPYDGAVIDGWIAPPLNAHNPTPVVWTENELYSYLRTGTAPLHGSAAGPMSPVAHRYIGRIPEADVRAIAHYFASLDDAANRQSQDGPALANALAMSSRNLIGPQQDSAARLYQGACAACHYNNASGPVSGRPELALNNALWLDEPNNLYQVLLHGIGASEGQSGIAMPSFYAGLTDADMARLAAYLRATRTTRPPWTDLEAKAAKLRSAVGPASINASH